MTTIISYITAFIVFTVVNSLIIWFVYIPLKPIVSIYRKFILVAAFLYAALGGFLGVYCYLLLTENFFITNSYLMLLIPAIFHLIVDKGRITKAKQGHSGVKYILDSNNESENYDQMIDIRHEQIVLYSRMVGFLLALFTLMGNEPFFK